MLWNGFSRNGSRGGVGGTRCLLGIDICERKERSRTGQREKSNFNAAWQSHNQPFRELCREPNGQTRPTSSPSWDRLISFSLWWQLPEQGCDLRLSHSTADAQLKEPIPLLSVHHSRHFTLQRMLSVSIYLSKCTLNAHFLYNQWII